MNKYMSIDHPEYIETKLHNAKITSLCISKDLEFYILQPRMEVYLFQI